jgi:hypothetical protein
LITQRVSIAETCAWVRWKDILFKKIRKKNQQQQLFFLFFFGFDDLKWNYSKCNFLLNLKKLPMKNNYMMYVCSKFAA